jgi:hypothetical protein
MPNGHYEVLTRRDGSSGTSYARREVNCTAPMTFRYLGDGDTVDEARKDTPNQGHMAHLVPGAISAEIVEAVCAGVSTRQ